MNKSTVISNVNSETGTLQPVPMRKAKAKVNVYLRSKASTVSDPIRVINEGEDVQVYKNGGSKDFYKVLCNGDTGYCVKQYIEILKPEPTKVEEKGDKDESEQ